MRRRRRSADRALADLVAGVDAGGDLEQVLRAVLDDPLLRVGYAADDGAFADAAGATLVAAAGAPATVLEHGGRAVALVVHGRPPGRVLGAIRHAAAVAADNARLARELEASVSVARRSRAEVVAAADAARRQAERDLHDGAQQRLVAALLDTRMLLLDPAEPDVQAPLERAAGAIEGALADLRRLSRGLFPAVLPEHGLGAALGVLATAAPVALTLDPVPDVRWPGPVEHAAWACVATALAAAQGALQVRIVDHGARGLELRVDGPLALEPDDAQALDDRLAALGGTLAVRPGVLGARLPV